MAPRSSPEAAVYVDDPRGLVAGNAVRLLRGGGEAFPAWLAAIESARERISMEMYIFNDDRVGRRFADALGAAARRGVTVRLLYDFVGSRDAPASFFAGLRAAGVHTITYHAYRFWRPRFYTLLRRNHRKTLTVDGRVTFAGGINLAQAWAPAAEGGDDWRDAALEIRGPAVRVVETTFLEIWNRRAKKRVRLDPEALARPAPEGEVRLSVVSNRELRDRFAIRHAGLYAIRESRRRIWLANPYFVPDRGIMRALRYAARRGVDVRVLLPLLSDARIVDLAGRHTYGPLLGDGVRIFHLDRVVHTKALLVDDQFLSIGSYNLDHRSLAYNLEMVVNVLDAGCAADFAALFDEDVTQAMEVTATDHAARPPVLRLLEWLAYQVRYWL